MKFFIDTADTNEIKIANDMGLIDGVTTNPSLIAKSGKPFLAVIKEICEIVDGPISAEVVSLDAAGMLKEGRELAKMHKNIVVKVPLTRPVTESRARVVSGVRHRMVPPTESPSVFRSRARSPPSRSAPRCRRGWWCSSSCRSRRRRSSR